MPLRFLENIGNAYIPPDVNFFDRKAMELQQRHDSAREAWSKSIQDISNNPYIDAQAKQQFLKEQNQMFQDVVQKHKGNLSAGYQDILGAIETVKSHPYHNLAARQVQELQQEEALRAKFGPEAIVRSNVGQQKLYTQGEEGQPIWLDPNQLRADVIQADDYAKNFEAQMAELKPFIEEYTGPLTGVPGTPAFLQSVYTSLKQLPPERLTALVNDNRVQQAFLANNPTALQDTRYLNPNNPAGGTYQDMFSDKGRLADFLLGNIIDKEQFEVREKTDFRQNPIYMANYRHRLAKNRDRAKAKYEYDLSRIGQGNALLPVQENTSTSVTDKDLLDMKGMLAQNVIDKENNFRDQELILENASKILNIPKEEITPTVIADAIKNNTSLSEQDIADLATHASELNETIKMEMELDDTFSILNSTVNTIDNNIWEQYKKSNPDLEKTYKSLGFNNEEEYKEALLAKDVSWGENTGEQIIQAADNLLKYFGSDISLTDVNARDAFLLRKQRDFTLYKRNLLDKDKVKYTSKNTYFVSDNEKDVVNRMPEKMNKLLNEQGSDYALEAFEDRFGNKMKNWIVPGTNKTAEEYLEDNDHLKVVTKFGKKGQFVVGFVPKNKKGKEEDSNDGGFVVAGKGFYLPNNLEAQNYIKQNVGEMLADSRNFYHNLDERKKREDLGYSWLATSQPEGQRLLGDIHRIKSLINQKYTTKGSIPIKVGNNVYRIRLTNGKPSIMIIQNGRPIPYPIKADQFENYILSKQGKYLEETNPTYKIGRVIEGEATRYGKNRYTSGKGKKVKVGDNQENE